MIRRLFSSVGASSTSSRDRVARPSQLVPPSAAHRAQGHPHALDARHRDSVGWDEAHPYFHIGVPDLCNAPICHSLYDHASFMLGTSFKGARCRLHETNTAPLTEGEQDRLIGEVMPTWPSSGRTAAA